MSLSSCMYRKLFSDTKNTVGVGYGTCHKNLELSHGQNRGQSSLASEVGQPSWIYMHYIIFHRYKSHFPYIIKLMI